MPSILSGLNSKGTNSGTHSSAASGYNPLGSLVPLRESPEQPDKLDSDRISTYLRDWNRQTDTLLVADRQIEYNVRMLCNQQWSFWNWEAGQFMDVADWFTAEEQRWRQLPTVNEELRWFVNTHSRLTENPPILTFLPGPDKTDADLAEVLDTLVKLDWRRAGMSTLHPEIMMWVVIAGRGHCVSRLDLTKGEWRPWVGTAPIPLVDGQLQPLLDRNGQPMMTPQPVPDVPIKYDGTPNAVLAPNGQVIVTGKGHMERTGGVAADVLSPLQVRGEWGPQLWHQKRWHGIQRFLTPEQVFEQYKVEVEPDVNTEGAANVAILERVLYGAGFYGTSRGLIGGSGYPGADVKGPLCTVFERWDAPLAFDPKLVGTWAEPMMETPDEPPAGPLHGPTRGNPGGRHLVFTPKAVISDGPREVRWPHTSPVRCWDFVRLPGRPRGTTSLESLHSPQRTVNKLTQLLQDATSLNGAPQRVLWEGMGIQPGDVDNAPNRVYLSTGEPGVMPMAFLQPAALSPDTYRVLGIMMDNLDRLGGTKGTTGAPPSEDPSGVAVQELRFNADRDLGDTARRAAEEYARQAEDWRALYSLVYTLPQVIAAGGSENAARTIVVWPELFAEGNVRVQADAESMLPEGRSERQARAERLWQLGAFGDPRDPNQWAQATDNFLEISRFPNYSRMARPGGVDRVTAEEENGQFLLGVPGQPVLPWYDDAVHLAQHYRFMKSREFLKQPPPVQQAMEFHVMQHEMSQQKKQLAAAAAQAEQMRAAGIDPAQQMGGHQPPSHGAPHKGGGGSHRHIGKGGAGKGPPGPDNTESRPAGVQPPAHNPKSRGGANGHAPLTP